MADDYLLNPDLIPSSDSDDSKRGPGNDDFLRKRDLTPVGPPSSSCLGCGCMDNGNMPNTYQNNWGFTGSVLAPNPTYPNGIAALNYDPLAVVDDGTCIYSELGTICGCNDPSSPDFIGQLYQNGYGGAPFLGGTGSWSPDWNLHPGYFTDCAGNVRNSHPYLSIGPYGETSCCEIPDDGLYNYRDIFMSVGSGGPTNGVWRGLPADGGCGSGSINPTKPFSVSSVQPYPLLEGHIGFDWFTISPNLKDVHGVEFKPSDFHTSETGWTIQIYDYLKNYLGTWHYEKCHSWKITPDIDASMPAGNWVSQNPQIVSGGQWGWGAVNYGLADNIKLNLYGVTHVHGPDPIVNYGNNLIHQTGSYQNSQHTTNVAQKALVPKYYTSNYLAHSVSFAYIKIVTDRNRSVTNCNSNPQGGGGANPSTAPQVSGLGGMFTNPGGKWFEDIHTGSNTDLDMNVMCYPCKTYDNTLSGAMNTQYAIGAIGTSCCDSNSTYHTTWPTVLTQCGPQHINPNYPYMSCASHWLHPWPASHKFMPINVQWYQNLATGFSHCGIPPYPPNCQQ